MKDEKQTREKLLKSAKTEFLEKGFMKASLRNICKNAGVTTGALYFFFEDKEDLFGSLIEKPLQEISGILTEHLEAETKDVFAHEELGLEAELEVAREIMHSLYAYYDEINLLISKSQGSKYENYVDGLVERLEEHYGRMADAYIDRMGGENVAEYLVHWMSHVQVDAFVHMLTHEPSEKKAQEQMVAVVEYLVAGWKGIFPVR